MGKHNCAVIGCTNSRYQLEKWRNNPCAIHAGQNHDVCGCELPYRLYCLPGPKRLRSKEKDGLGALSGLPKTKSHGIHVVVIGYALSILWMAFLQKRTPIHL